ncbi:hypothetical protein M0811_08527 [Anaeramoeba ignava]|uniref:Uncharacterized protein n=1 Tax=Anaeramoeba ignava TaxID=1746090 RepID=A0A9Q0LJL2_ANAIG|nr:hypothetical protein M0811_08527 [Anaeramoeba ignava]
MVFHPNFHLFAICADLTILTKAFFSNYITIHFLNYFPNYLLIIHLLYFILLLLTDIKKFKLIHQKKSTYNQLSKPFYFDFEVYLQFIPLLILIVDFFVEPSFNSPLPPKWKDSLFYVLINLSYSFWIYFVKSTPGLRTYKVLKQMKDENFDSFFVFWIIFNILLWIPGRIILSLRFKFASKRFFSSKKKK